MKINKVKIKNAAGRFEEHEIGVDANNIHFSTTENAEQVIAAQNNNTSELDLQYQILEKEYDTSTPIEDYDLIRNIDEFEARPYDDTISKIKVAKVKKSDGSWGDGIELEAKSTGVALNNNKDAEAEVTMLKNKIAALENIEETLTPKLAQRTAQQIEEGKNLSVIGIDEDKDYDFKILGESKQETRSGRNLFNLDNIRGHCYTWQDATYTISEDTIKITTPARRDNCGIFIKAHDWIKDILNKTVTMSLEYKVADITMSSFQFGFEGEQIIRVATSTEWQKASVTATIGATNVLIFYGDNAQNENANKLYIRKLQIEEGTIITNYEQYGVMPSPGFPSEIRSAGGQIRTREHK